MSVIPSERRLLILTPWWLSPRVHNWTGHRHWLRFTVVSQTWNEDTGWRGPFTKVGRRWTWTAARKLRESVRGAR